MKGPQLLSAHLSIEMNLLRLIWCALFFSNNFFDPNYGAHSENNYFSVRTKLA